MKGYIVVSLGSALLASSLTWALLPRTGKVPMVQTSAEVQPHPLGTSSSTGTSPITTEAQKIKVAEVLANMARAPAVQRSDEAEPKQNEPRDPPPKLDDVRRDFLRMATTNGGPTTAGPESFKMVESIKRLGKEGLYMLLEEVDHGDKRNRMLASHFLGQLNDPQAIASLGETAISDKDETVAAVASQSLALMDSPDTIEELRRLVASPNGAATEINALYGLCKFGDPEGVRLAMAYLNNTEKSAQEKAILIVNLARVPQPAILPVMDLAVTLFATSPAPVLQSVIQYYASLASPEGKARLGMLASNQGITQELRQAAAAALAQAG